VVGTFIYKKNNYYKMLIREMIIEDGEDGVYAISLVDFPAIMKNFVHFNEQIELRTVDVGGGYFVDLDDFFKYTATPEPEKIPTSHTFCNVKAWNGSNAHHISEIRSWDRFRKMDFNGKASAFIEESSFFKDFNGINNYSFNIDEQIYNCRHHFARVRRIKEIPAYKQQMYKKPYPNKIEQSKEYMSEIQFKVDKEKKEIAGPALIPNLMIYRNDVGGSGDDGYVFLSAKTIKKIKENYGFNRTLTIQHETDITGRAILLDSFIYPEKNENYGVEVPDGTWFLRYKIIDEKLWEVIKEQDIIGFSIEGMFNLKEPNNE
jgi:hypothetical protein